MGQRPLPMAGAQEVVLDWHGVACVNTALAVSEALSHTPIVMAAVTASISPRTAPLLVLNSQSTVFASPLSVPRAQQAGSCHRTLVLTVSSTWDTHLSDFIMAGSWIHFKCPILSGLSSPLTLFYYPS